VQNLKLALRYDPANSFAYYELYLTYQAMGDTAQAATSLRRILEMQPKSLREKCQQDDARQNLFDLSKK
jgi:Tfp pilus assembly protein PilF